MSCKGDEVGTSDATQSADAGGAAVPPNKQCCCYAPPRSFSLITDAELSRHMMLNSEDFGREGSDCILYALPPRVTSVRLVHPHRCTRQLPAAAAGGKEAAAGASSSSSSSCSFDALLPPVLQDDREFRCTTLAECGLRECVLVEPTPERLSYGMALMNDCAARKDTKTETSGDHEGEDASAGSKKKMILVDAACGEAVLRGSHVFAPGIVASSYNYEAGDFPVQIIALHKFNSNSPASPLLELASGTGSPPAHDNKEASAATATAAPSVTLKGSYFDTNANGIVGSSLLSLRTVTVGIGKVAISRKQVVSGCGGVAIENVANPLMHPALGALPVRFDKDVFLQNFSSMIPVELLLPRLLSRRSSDSSGFSSMLVLDMCAAPGGKSSHILSRFEEAIDTATKTAVARGGEGGGEQSPTCNNCSFKLVSCERSKSRAKQMQNTLAFYHGDTFCKQHLEVKTVDANTLAKDPQWQCKFDRILLDPPCTGLGLRPRLQPHSHTLRDVQMSADYQRHLIASAHALLKADGGLLSYSTCTVTREENEENVHWALETFRDLRLVAASRPEELAILHLARGGRSKGDDSSSPSSSSTPITTTTSSSSSACSASPQKLMMRFGPSADETKLDSVGFFVALFEKI